MKTYAINIEFGTIPALFSTQYNNLHTNKEINMQNLQTLKQNVQKGFTLIELMIVVAIIGILAALAIPAYTDYTIKSRVSEGASLVGAAKTAMEVYWSENGTEYGPGAPDTETLIAFDLNLCGTADCNSWDTKSEYVSAITLDGAAGAPQFTVEYKNSTALGTASGDCVVYFPNFTDEQNIEWEVRAETAYETAGGRTVPVATLCDVAAIPNKYKPKV